jgi:hypothetical protein
VAAMQAMTAAQEADAKKGQATQSLGDFWAQHVADGNVPPFLMMTSSKIHHFVAPVVAPVPIAGG